MSICNKEKIKTRKLKLKKVDLNQLNLDFILCLSGIVCYFKG